MENTADSPVALITGGARRIGASIARTLHAAGYRIVLHYRSSAAEAEQLQESLQQNRGNSCTLIKADLNQMADIQHLAQQSVESFGRLDLLVNNASSFYPTPLGTATEHQWDDLFASNAKAPLFLSQALSEALQQNQGAIINIADIHAAKPLREHTIYCMAKAANVMLTQSLAKELAPHIRVNGIAPGAILWPENEAELDQEGQQKILDQVPLQRPGTPDDIAATVLFLARDNRYITGQIIPVDGGRTLGH